MLAPAAGPLEGGAEGLCALYVSLNRPVVTLDALPVGPAAAAVLLHAGGGASLLVRSVRTGTVACFACPPPNATAQVFSRAEAWGFLFEEQPSGVEASDRAEWPAWLAELVPESATRAPEELSTWLSKFRFQRAAAENGPAGVLDLVFGDTRIGWRRTRESEARPWRVLRGRPSRPDGGERCI